MSTSHHAKVSGLELDVIENLALVNIVSDGVVHLDQGVGIADGSAIVRHEEWNAPRASLNTLDAAQLVLGLLLADLVKNKATLHVVEQTEEVTGLLDRDDICNATKHVLVCLSVLWVIQLIRL